MKNNYSTDNLGLASYLALKGLVFIEAKVEVIFGKKKVVMFFEDSLGQASILDREYVASSEKKYRDFIFFFRNKIDEALKG